MLTDPPPVAVTVVRETAACPREVTDAPPLRVARSDEPALPGKAAPVPFQFPFTSHTLDELPVQV